MYWVLAYLVLLLMNSTDLPFMKADLKTDRSQLQVRGYDKIEMQQ